LGAHGYGDTRKLSGDSTSPDETVVPFDQGLFALGRCRPLSSGCLELERGIRCNAEQPAGGEEIMDRGIPETNQG